jgi:SAM-dependent methyltransferase
MSEDNAAGHESQGVWRRNSRHWSQVGSPLRPLPEDGELMMALAQASLQGRAEPCIAVLGVTPEVVQQPWPDGSSLVALDHSAEMIRSVWQPHPRIASRVAQARWEQIPLADQSVDLAVGDGSLNNLTHVGDYGTVVAEVARILRPGGAMVLRCFVRPDQRESIAAIAHDVWQGHVKSFHALKWRLAMLITGEDDASVKVADIRDLFESTFADRQALAEATGWPRGAIDTIDSYRGLSTRYTFPTLDQFRRAAGPALRVEAVRSAGYELADRCPTLLFVPARQGV